MAAHSIVSELRRSLTCAARAGTPQAMVAGMHTNGNPMRRVPGAFSAVPEMSPACPGMFSISPGKPGYCCSLMNIFIALSAMTLVAAKSNPPSIIPPTGLSKVTHPQTYVTCQILYEIETSDGLPSC